MPDRTDGRLPSWVRPSLYNLALTVIPDEHRFGGTVTIDVQVDRPTQEIVLHALDLNIEQVEVSSADRTLSADVQTDPASEAVILRLDETVAPGPAQIFLTFSGSLNRQLRGLYEVQVGDETYAFTQFEATDARRMFPCFDEPAMKARFRLSVCFPAHLTALSNMPRLNEQADGKLRTVSFGETPVMSTYLLALAVARMESRATRIGNTMVAVCTPPGQIHLASFAFKVTAGVLPLLNDYFDLPYPYPKLDLVSVPNFSMGAMENWGAIFFRDSRLLVDEAQTSTATLRDVANVITHEIVHQWFGNLVTMQWWDDLWLNEAFATWLAVKIVDQWRPEWNSWVEFQQEKEVPLAIDALDSTRAIRADVTHAAEIEEMFDALTYEKGAACLRMIEQFLGESSFREGIRHYIKTHAFQNAQATALWSALSDASGKPVSEMARDWFARPGFPIVSLRAVDGNCAHLTLEQKRFRALGKASGEAGDLWTIPFVLRYKDAQGVREHPVLLTEATTSVVLPAEGNVTSVFGNAKEAGFLRTHHDPALWQGLSTKEDLLPEEKIGLLNHLWAEALRGDATIGDFMSALLGFRGDPCRVVVQGAAAYLETLSHQLVAPKDRARFAAWVKNWFAPLWEELGWNTSAGEDDERRLSRASALWALGALAHDEEILSELPRQQTRYWAKPESLDPTLATPLIRLCARTDGGSLFEPYLKRFQTGETPEERDRYLIGLTDFQKPDLALKVLGLTLSDAVRTQDVWKPVRYLLANPATQEVAWNFVQRNWSALKQKGGSVGAQRIIQGTKHLWRLEWRDEVGRLFNDPAHRVDAARRTLSQTLEFIDIGLWFRASQQARLSAYLNVRG